MYELEDKDYNNNPYTKPAPVQDPNFNPYAAPTATVGDMYASNSYTNDNVLLATRGSRLSAILLDSLIMFTIALPFALVAILAGGDGTTALIVYGLMALVMLGYGIYNLILMHNEGQTVGKKIMKIKIVRGDFYTNPGLGRLIVLRYLPFSVASMIPIIGSLIQIADYLFIFQADQRCLHDMIADTHVIQVNGKSNFATQAENAYNSTQSSNW